MQTQSFFSLWISLTYLWHLTTVLFVKCPLTAPALAFFARSLLPSSFLRLCSFACSFSVNSCPFVFSVHLFFTGNFLHSQDMKNLYVTTTSMHHSLSPSDTRPIIQLSGSDRFKSKTFTSPTVPLYSVSVKYRPLVHWSPKLETQRSCLHPLTSDLK